MLFSSILHYKYSLPAVQIISYIIAFPIHIVKEHDNRNAHCTFLHALNVGIIALMDEPSASGRSITGLSTDMERMLFARF